MTRKLLQTAQDKNISIIGPATVGGIKPGCFKIGNTGGKSTNCHQFYHWKFMISIVKILDSRVKTIQFEYVELKGLTLRPAYQQFLRPLCILYTMYQKVITCVKLFFLTGMNLCTNIPKNFTQNNSRAEF